MSSLLSRMQSWQDSRQVDRHVLDYRGTRRNAERHYDREEQGFVPNSSHDRLLCESKDPPKCWIVTQQDGGEKVYDLPEGVWWGVIGRESSMRLELVVTKPAPTSKADFLEQLVHGPAKVYTAPVVGAEDLQKPSELSKSTYVVHKDHCAYCGHPVDPDGDLACAWKGRLFCTESCADRMYGAHDVPPPPPRHHTARWGWRNTHGTQWELVPVAGMALT